jgi:hypothetical protein
MAEIHTGRHQPTIEGDLVVFPAARDRIGYAEILK